jgi:iron(III) transport system ATP-binding protein
MPPILDIQNLSKSYDGKKLALSNCNFQLEQGKICAIVGESGSGKTTLLRLIAGLERPNKGAIKINGKIVSNDTLIVPPQKRELGFVFQNFALFPHLTVEQNIAFGLKKDKATTIERVLKLTKMEGFEKSYPNQLSGGQKQRIALARTIAQQPNLLLLDEPFSNLDAHLKSELRQEIKTIIKRLGITMIFITHDIMDAIDIAEKIILLKQGTIVAYDSIEKFSKNTENKEVQQLLSELEKTTNQTLNFLNKK